MKNKVIKSVLLTTFSMCILLSCKKKDTSSDVSASEPDHSLDSMELLAQGKGFKKVYGYIEPGGALFFPGTLNEIHGLDLTVEGTDKVNFAFMVSNGSQQGLVKSVLRASVNYNTSTQILAPFNFTYTSPSGSSWESLGYSFAPYSNKLGFMYYMYTGAGFVSGDISELSGQSLLSTDRRIAKTGHSVYNVVGSQGQNSGTETNNFTYAYYTTSGSFVQFSSSDGTFTGLQFPLRPSSAYRGIFEPIVSTNEGIVALYHKDSVCVYLNNLATPAVKFSRIAKASLSSTMALNGYSIIKNNNNDNNFSFACIEGNKAWTFTFNNTTKTLSKVLDGLSLRKGAKSIDVDEFGNLYYFESNTVYKVEVTGTVSVAENILANGNLSVLKYYNGKLFLLAERFSNADGSQGRRQLDVLVSN